MTQSNQRVEDPDHYLNLAFEYYVAGRFAAIKHLRIAANLLHHAFELLLKHGLLQNVPEARIQGEAKKLKNRPYSHDLDGLWPEYKRTVGNSQLDRFDSIVTDLNRWEDLRYGGFPTGQATTIVFSVGLDSQWRQQITDPETYVLVLEEIDELFAEILAASGIDPKHLGVRFDLDTEIQAWYLKENQFATVFDPTPTLIK